jgi:hypothetical protein
MHGHPIAVAGQCADAVRRAVDTIGFDVRLVIDPTGQIEETFIELAAARDVYDAVLVDADGDAPVLCSRLARELGVVALDIGAALRRLLYPPGLTQTEFDARWLIDLYVRQAAEPPPADPHRLEGRLVRERGTAAVFYIERGRARWITHRDILGLVEGDVAELEPGELAAIPPGLRVGVVHDGQAGIYVLIDGHKLPVNLGLPVAPIDSQALSRLPLAERPLPWFPGAGG